MPLENVIVRYIRGNHEVAYWNIQIRRMRWRGRCERGAGDGAGGGVAATRLPPFASLTLAILYCWWHTCQSKLRLDLRQKLKLETGLRSSRK